MDKLGKYSEMQILIDGKSTTVRVDYGIAQWQNVEVTIAVIDGIRWVLVADVGPLFGSGMESNRIWRLCPETDRCLLDGFMFIKTSRAMAAMLNDEEDLSKVAIDFSDNAIEINALMKIAGLG